MSEEKTATDEELTASKEGIGRIASRMFGSDQVITAQSDQVITAQGTVIRKGSKASGEVVRLSLDVSPELNETLETLARKIHGSKSDVLRKAIVLMEVAVKAKEDKKKFGVAAPEQPLETEIVGL